MSTGAEDRPATVVVTDFYKAGDLQPDAETATRAAVPRQLTFHITYGGAAHHAVPEWTAVCADIADFVAAGTGSGREEIGSAILDQLADFRDPQP